MSTIKINAIKEQTEYGQLEEKVSLKGGTSIIAAIIFSIVAGIMTAQYYLGTLVLIWLFIVFF